MYRSMWRAKVLTLMVCVVLAVASLAAYRFLSRGETYEDPIDLRAVDWRSVEIPGSLCRSPKPIRLRDGSAVNVPSDFDGPEPNMPQDVAALTDEIFYGDITGDDRDESALPVVCANHDSTAAGQRAMGILVFDGGARELSVLGTLTSRKPRLGEPPNLLKVESMKPGRITIVDSFYLKDDFNCCPSGQVEETWVYRQGRLAAR
ncbi:hypothetical protein [Streptomyces xantholiticus]|uniref:hypothetical protein n=1 Tax=Streptomyces xantholiticus TaxID=68285 RepID=UPI001675F8E1|nr:hypothetical protein [Streptomyces xantholiticus]GGW65533.1 hypothetical protein GCM10010381_58270 [Streptomyces xantholiticus]